MLGVIAEQVLVDFALDMGAAGSTFANAGDFVRAGNSLVYAKRDGSWAMALDAQEEKAVNDIFWEKWSQDTFPAATPIAFRPSREESWLGNNSYQQHSHFRKRRRTFRVSGFGLYVTADLSKWPEFLSSPGKC
ncbi:hypothetical protein N0V87_010681 [Didymella glomerata]|uniref:Uncharacterized protein n=1 Tax=Didymella glomerata TaxID=749621 RepID=A0A9W8WNQ4_9PLEO|nr:hypothetical protein N0V87_010681 [Didymella glomerata]